MRTIPNKIRNENFTDLTKYKLTKNKNNELKLTKEEIENMTGELEDIDIPIDVVNVFRPSKEAPILAEQTVKIGAKVLWLQFGIQNKKAQEIVEIANITYIANKCIKQEYQRLFLKVSPVFPVLQ